ncbi:unnamed protein product [Angiostrongylus costaricensis]|uniref:Aa_trans domain-containing protein n=1 Tax=Angiostrongylus costaricensis TaxID=334426 RepID=A0A158PLG8_ANGCS|nr:unnamed protein product [Angiostrongylus costaricensis]
MTAEGTGEANLNLFWPLSVKPLVLETYGDFLQWLTIMVEFTSTAPYILILILFSRAITLEGSTDGLYYYWGKPDFSKLLRHQDAWIVVTGDFLMSVFGGATVFATLGYLSYQLKKPIEEVVSSGHSLAFVAYPEAISKMPYPMVWSVFFFSMLFLLGISSEIALTETLCTSIYDQWTSTRKCKWLISLSCCGSLFLCGIVLTTDVGTLFNTALIVLFDI